MHARHASHQAAIFVMQERQAAQATAPSGAPLPNVLASASTRLPATKRAAESWAGDAPRRRVRPRRATTYHDLPAEILQEIAAHVSFDDIGSLSTATRRTYCALREKRLSWLCCQRADNVYELDFESVQQLLGEIDRIRAEPALRAAPLEALWPRIPQLPDQQQLEAFKRVFEAAGRVPTLGWRIQKDMIGTILELSPRHQLDLYHFAYAAAEQGGAEQGSLWAALAWLLRCLSLKPLHFESEFLALLNRLPSLDVSAQADLIVQLAVLLPNFYDNGTHSNETLMAYYRVVYEWVQRVPASHRGAPLGMLANQIWLLPDAQVPAHYANLRRLTQWLPDHQLGGALRYLPVALETLPSEQHADEIALLEPIIQRVLPEQRTVVALGLLEGATGLNESLSRRVWQRALRLLDGGNEGDVLSVLSEINERHLIPLLSEQQWEDARAEIMAYVERNLLSEATRARLFDYIEEEDID